MLTKRIIGESRIAAEFADGKLRGAQLDCFRVYSCVLELCFAAADPGHGTLHEVWLSIAGDISLEEPPGGGPSAPPALADFLPLLHRLIGTCVGRVRISDEGALMVSLGSDVLVISADEAPEEIAWQITPESPAPYAKHAWSVAFTDHKEIVLTLSED